MQAHSPQETRAAVQTRMTSERISSTRVPTIEEQAFRTLHQDETIASPTHLSCKCPTHLSHKRPIPISHHVLTSHFNMCEISNIDVPVVLVLLHSTHNCSFMEAQVMPLCQRDNSHCTMTSKVVLLPPAVLLPYMVYVPASSRLTVLNVMLVAVRATLLEEVIATPFLDQVK